MVLLVSVFVQCGGEEVCVIGLHVGPLSSCSNVSSTFSSGRLPKAVGIRGILLAVYQARLPRHQARIEMFC
jgi:hypothetical protein